jgi:hypothetical protein
VRVIAGDHQWVHPGGLEGRHDLCGVAAGRVGDGHQADQAQWRLRGGRVRAATDRLFGRPVDRPVS